MHFAHFPITIEALRWNIALEHFGKCSYTDRNIALEHCINVPTSTADLFYEFFKLGLLIPVFWQTCFWLLKTGLKPVFGFTNLHFAHGPITIETLHWNIVLMFLHRFLTYFTSS